MRQKNVFNKKQYRTIAKFLSSALTNIIDSPDDSVKDLLDFDDKINDYLEVGILNNEQGIELLNLSIGTQDRIQELTNGVDPPLWPGVICLGQPPGPPPSNIPSFHVSADVAEDGDGSPGNPFKTIGSALANAEAMGFEAVELLIAAGRYEEHIVITRHTRLVGQGGAFIIPVIAGSITNLKPFSLHVHNIAIVDLRTGPPGAIYIQHPCASTFLSNVFVLGAAGFGIFQRGGAFNAHDLAIEGTYPLSSKTGVAMQLDGDVNVYLQDVRLSRNHGGGIFIQHPGTQVFATQLEIADTEVNPFSEEEPGLHPGTSGIYIGNGATITGHWVRIRDSDFVGLYVHNEAVANFFYTTIRHTRGIEDSDEPGGYNVLVLNGTLEMRIFALREAWLCGIGLYGASSVDLFDGEIADNNIGACVLIDGYDPNRLGPGQGVIYRNNGTNYYTGELSPPDPPPTIFP
jgi:hypothetical protein